MIQPARSPDSQPTPPSLHLVSDLPPLDVSHAVKAFLDDETIGPLTGLVRLITVLDMPKEPDRPELAPVREKMYAGMLLCYLVTEDYKNVDKLIDDPKNPLTRVDEVRIQNTLANTTTNHRFETLLFDYAAIAERERDLARDRRLLRWQEKRYDPEIDTDVAPLLTNQGKNQYDIERQLLGIQLARGEIKESMRTIAEMEEVARTTEFPIDQHTVSVATYLRNGGARRLRQRMHNPVHMIRQRYGTRNDPGMQRKLVNNLASEGMYSAANNVIIFLGGVGGTLGVQWLTKNYPEIKVAATTLQSIFPYFGQ